MLLHFVGVVVQVTSRPLVIVSPPLPVPKLLFQPRPCAFCRGLAVLTHNGDSFRCLPFFSSRHSRHKPVHSSLVSVIEKPVYFTDLNSLGFHQFVGPGVVRGRNVDIDGKGDIRVHAIGPFLNPAKGLAAVSRQKPLNSGAFSLPLDFD